MTDVVFIDTETTSLRHARAWEIALILRRPDAPDYERSWFIDARDLELGNADLMSLRIGRFHERHPQQYRPADLSRLTREATAMVEIEKLTRGAHLVGAVPNFDAEVLGNRMRAHEVCPSWHYHLIDAETLAAGYLAANRAFRGELPWDSEALSKALDVNPGEFDRHTAMGDARWARAMYDKMMNDAAF